MELPIPSKIIEDQSLIDLILELVKDAPCEESNNQRFLTEKFIFGPFELNIHYSTELTFIDYRKLK